MTTIVPSLAGGATGADAATAQAMVASPPRALAIAGFASMGAGAIHAAAIGVHSEHRQAVIAFTIVAAFQLGCGALGLLRSGRLVAAIGAVGNAAVIGGWALAKADGISFVDGLEESESVQTADGLAAGLAIVAVLAALAYAMSIAPRVLAVRGRGLTTMSAIFAASLAVPGMISAGGHAHAGGHDESAAGHHDDAAATPSGEGGGGEQHTVVPPTPYEPTKPIDLSGVEGVTPEQQARAENLVAVTLLRLPQFADPAAAEAAGYKSIGDAFTGHEHYINTALFDDGKILDPDYPESLVYQPDPTGTGKTLVAAMYMLGSDDTLEDVPDVGGKLTQWHIHDNLCFTAQGTVAGLANADGTCNPPLFEGSHTPMIHVWITSHPCGPFAALEGVGGGRIPDGEARWCDHAHGAS